MDEEEEEEIVEEKKKRKMARWKEGRRKQTPGGQWQTRKGKKQHTGQDRARPDQTMLGICLSNFWVCVFWGCDIVWCSVCVCGSERERRVCHDGLVYLVFSITYLSTYTLSFFLLFFLLPSTAVLGFGIYRFYLLALYRAIWSARKSRTRTMSKEKDQRYDTKGRYTSY